MKKSLKNLAQALVGRPVAYAVLFFAVSSATHAQTVFTAVDNGNNQWGLASRWTPNVIPTATTDVNFTNASGASAVRLNNTSHLAEDVIYSRTSSVFAFQNTSSSAQTVDFTSLELALGSTALMFQQVGSGSIDFEADTLTLNTGTSLSLGDPAGDRILAPSTIRNVTVTGATSLAGTLTFSRVTGTANLGDLTTSTGAVLNLTSGASATQGTNAGNTVTVTSLAGSSGIIQANKASTVGSFVIDGGMETSFGGTIQNGAGTVSLTKQGSGVQTLSGANTYTGATTVSTGTLAITGDLSNSSTVTVTGSAAGSEFRYSSATARTGTINLNGAGSGSRAILSGEGDINVALTLNDLGDTLSPGNSPGEQTFGVNQTWNSFTYVWETNNFTGTTAGTDFDTINITGSLNLTGGLGSYALDITSLTGLNQAGNVGNFSEVNRTWTILSTTTGITGFNVANWSLNDSGFTSSPTWQGDWSLGQAGNNLVLTYTAIPEPTSVVMLGLAAVFLLILRRRKLATR